MENVLKQLDSLIRILSEDFDYSDEQSSSIAYVQDQTGYPLPTEVSRILVEEELIPDSFPNIFMGYEPLGLSGVVNEYKDLKQSLFFKGFAVDENLNAAPDHELRIFENEFGDCEDQEVVSDIKRLVPLFYGGAGYYIALFSLTKEQSEIVVVTQDYGICTLAPTFLAHLNNLKIGLLKGLYKYDEELGEIDYPESWYERVRALK